MFKMTFENMRRGNFSNNHIMIDVLLDGKKAATFQWNPFWYGQENDFLKLASKKKCKQELVNLLAGYSGDEKTAIRLLNIFQGKEWNKVLCKGTEDKLIDFLLKKDLIPMPKKRDVLYCLLSDAECFSSSGDFEDFCANLGYDTDSIKARDAYEECKETFLVLIQKLGTNKLEKLTERAQKYW